MLVCFWVCWCGIASSELAAVLLLGLRMVVPDVLRLLHYYSQTSSVVWLFCFLVVWGFCLFVCFFFFGFSQRLEVFVLLFVCLVGCYLLLEGEEVTPCIF